MSRATPAPSPRSRTGVLLCNLGTPEAPTAPAVRRYLAQFLGDPRVVEIPRWLWMPVLHGLILRVRPARSAAKYASIWTPDGSPLRIWTERQSRLLTGYLGERGHPVLVRDAMRYGAPSIGQRLDELQALGATQILVLPLYPQYAASTTASIVDAMSAWTQRQRRLPSLRIVSQYADDAGYIAALEQRVRDHWRQEGRPDRLVLSFHGIPARSVAQGDPYQEQCRTTARLLRQRLELSEQEVLLTFQSRFGRARWLEPYTEPTLRELAAQGVGRVDVMCPGFVSDCLETLEEIGQEARQAFLEAGGREFHLIACLNDSHAWIRALAELTIRQLQGWEIEKTGTNAAQAAGTSPKTLGATP